MTTVINVKIKWALREHGFHGREKHRGVGYQSSHTKRSSHLSQPDCLFHPIVFSVSTYNSNLTYYLTSGLPSISVNCLSQRFFVLDTKPKKAS